MKPAIAMLFALAAAVTPVAGEIRPENVKAGLLVSSTTASPGQPIHAAIRLEHEPGWHSYWLNPGEAGLPTTIKWQLPAGWKAGVLGFPVPMRIDTGELKGFGYEGVTMLPVTLTPPEDFKGTAELKAALSWLACGKDGCVPGKADLRMKITSGNPQPGASSAEILAAIDRLPRPAGDSVRLMVTDDGKALTLTLRASGPLPLDFASSEVFPLTPDVIAPAARIRFVRNQDAWTATVPKSEFAKEPVKSLTLVLAAKDAGPALEVSWHAP